jgi:cell division initiation protein
VGKISPLDIRNQTFRTVFRGADNEEVRVFLDLVATEYESLLQEHSQLVERLRHCEDRLSEYRTLDQSLRDGVVTAEKLMHQARDASQRDADLLIQDAERRAELILQDAVDRMGRLNEEVRGLQTKRDIYTEQMRTFLASHMEMLERNEQYLQGVDDLHDETTAMMTRLRRNDARPGPPARRNVPRAGSETPARPAPPPPPEEMVEPDDAPAAPPAQSPQGRWPAPQSAPPPRVAPRFGRTSPNPDRVEAPRGGFPPQRREPAPYHDEGAERTEGLFEISAEDDDPSQDSR